VPDLRRHADHGRDVTPLKAAGVVAREVGKEAAKAARSFLRRLNP
jgi:hypothetical protein